MGMAACLIPAERKRRLIKEMYKLQTPFQCKMACKTRGWSSGLYPPRMPDTLDRHCICSSWTYLLPAAKMTKKTP